MPDNTRRFGDAGSEKSKVDELAAVDGEVLNLRGVDYLADFGSRRFDGGNFGGDGDGFAAGSNLQGDIESCRLADG